MIKTYPEEFKESVIKRMLPPETIQNEINSNEITDILISHFHKDHFNGVLEIPNTYRLRTAYLPYSIIDGKILYSKGIARLLSVASSSSWGFDLSTKILDLFRKLEKISKEIRFVKRGDTIPFDDDEIQVHWPEITSTKGFKYGDLPVKQIVTGPRLALCVTVREIFCF